MCYPQFEEDEPALFMVWPGRESNPVWSVYGECGNPTSSSCGRSSQRSAFKDSESVDDFSMQITGLGGSMSETGKRRIKRLVLWEERLQLRNKEKAHVLSSIRGG